MTAAVPVSKMNGCGLPGNAIVNGLVPNALRAAPSGTTVGVLLPIEIAAKPCRAIFSM